MYDSRRNRMVTTNSVFTHTFSFSDDSGWQRVWPPDPPQQPSALSGHLLVSDAAHEVVWSVGGYGEGNGVLPGIWKLDPAAEARWTWYPQPQQLPLSGNAAALDLSRHRILDASLNETPPGIIEVEIEDTPTQVVWTATGTRPAQRVDHTAVVDPVRGQLLVFGGHYFGPHFNGTDFGDLWSVPLDDLSAWTLLTPPGPTPPPRGAHFAFYDEPGDRMVVLGGWQQTGGPLHNYVHDAWALSLGGAPAWTQLPASWDPPFLGSLTYDPLTRRLFLFRAGATVATRGIDAWVTLATSGDPPLADAPIAFAPWCNRLVVATTNRSGPQADETWALEFPHASPLAARKPPRAPVGAPKVEARPQGRDGPHAPAGTTTQAPARAALSFAGTRPSPARGAARLAFALPSAAPVALELFDVRGTRVLSHDLGVQPAGEHEWTWRETAALRPGLYLARIQAGAARLEAKILLLP